MQLTITYTISRYGKKIDVIVNSQQRIGETIEILEEAGRLPYISDQECQIRSLRTGHTLQLQKNYEQNNIFYGDILEIL